MIDLDHLQESGGKQVRVRPTFHEELKRLGQEVDQTRDDMIGVLRDVERESKVRGTTPTIYKPIIIFFFFTIFSR